MFESSLSLAITEWGHVNCHKIDHEYYQVWQQLKDNFSLSEKK